MLFLRRLCYIVSRKGTFVKVPLLAVLLIALIVSTRSLSSRKLQQDAEPPYQRSHNKLDFSKDHPFVEGCAAINLENTSRRNATFVMLTRNTELPDVIKSIKSLERHFNQWFGYPWVFLNDEPFTEEFKDAVLNQTQSTVEFGVIPEDLWEFPKDIRETVQFKEFIETQGDRGIMYGKMESYHKMCRFYSGLFYKHPLVSKYEWYWRVEPDVEFFCDITYDPFLEMERNGKVYGFTIVIKELEETIPNLFRITKSFLKHFNIQPRNAWRMFVHDYRSIWNYKDWNKFDKLYKYIQHKDEMIDRISDNVMIRQLVKQIKPYTKANKADGKETLLNDEDLSEAYIEKLVNRAKRSGLPILQGEKIDGEDYNLHHFWSNFEIARVDLWNNEVYEAYFKYLEESGGFYKERWGDAPVHSLAIGFLLDVEQLHYFRDIGYQHTTVGHCPSNHLNQLPYTPNPQYSTSIASQDLEFQKYWSRPDQVKDYGTGCRCRCPKNFKDIEDSPSDYLGDFYEFIDDQYQPPKKLNVRMMEREINLEYKDFLKNSAH